MTQFANTRELISSWPGLDDAVRIALLKAISSRGKFKDYVLASSPATKDGVKYVAWQALIGELAPARASIGGLLFLNARQKALFHRIEKALGGDGLTLGFAIRAYEPPLRWSLFAHRYDVEALREAIYQGVTNA